MSKKDIDWDAIKAAYRANRLSVREIARQHGISAPAILKRAKKKGDEWQRDLGDEVAKATAAKLVRTPVNAMVNTANAQTDEQIVQEAAEANVQIIQAQRHSIRSAMDVCGDLMQQLSDVANNRKLIASAIIEARKAKTGEVLPDAAVSALLKSLSLPSHAAVLRDLSTSAKNLIALQRQAHNLGQDTGGTIEDWLAKYCGDL
jgi:DNA-binding Lrp family transcriptional regulator